MTTRHESGVGLFVGIVARFVGIAFLSLCAYFVSGIVLQPMSETLAVWGSPAIAVGVAGLLVWRLILPRLESPAGTRTLLASAAVLALLGVGLEFEAAREGAAAPWDSFAGAIPGLAGYALFGVAAASALSAGLLARRGRPLGGTGDDTDGASSEDSPSKLADRLFWGVVGVAFIGVVASGWYYFSARTR